MKHSIISRFLIISALILCTMATASAADRLFAETAAIVPGDVKTISFMLDNQISYYGFQTDIELPEGLQFVTEGNNKVAITLTDRASGFTTVSNLLSASSARIGAFSTEHNTFTGNSGVLFSIQVRASDFFKGGQLKLTKTSFVNSENTDVAFSDFSVTLSEYCYVSSITLNSSQWSGVEGSNFQLVATLTPANATDKSITWTTSNASVATVDASGKVTAIKVGTATITAKTSNGLEATCNVTVNPVLATSVVLSKSTLTLTIGSSETITATVSPTNTTDKTVSWTTSNSAVATVEGGKITAVAIGTATITACCGSVKKTCIVTVNPILAESVSISASKTQIMNHETLQLTAVVSPDNTTDKRVSWSSSNNKDVAKVDENGLITALGVGKATITAKVTANPSVIGTIQIEVLPRTMTLNGIIYEIVYINPDASSTDDYAKVVSGQPTAGTLTIQPEIVTTLGRKLKVKEVSANAFDGNSSITRIVIPQSIENVGSEAFANCANLETVRIDDSEKTLECGDRMFENSPFVSLYLGRHTSGTVLSGHPTLDNLEIGSKVTQIDANEFKNCKPITNLTVFATTPPTMPDNGFDNEVYENTILRVPDNETEAYRTASGWSQFANIYGINQIPTESISLDTTEIALTVGESHSFEVVFDPTNVTSKAIEWSSSNQAVASISTTGVVVALAPGEVIITATTTNGKTAECKVTVNPIKVTSVSIDPVETEITVGDVLSLSVSVDPDDATDQTIEWSSSDPKIASVDDNGNVKALMPGKVTVTAVSPDGPSADCSITVVAANVEVKEIILDNDELNMTEGEFCTLNAVIYPENATDKGISWTSSDVAVATVDANGKVTAIKAGTATVTAKASNGMTAACTITVVAKVHAVGDEFSYMLKGQTLNYIITDESAKTVKVAKTDISGDVVIPDKVFFDDVEYTVTSIDDFAFGGCSSLTSVEIPNSVISIGTNAFRGCAMSLVWIPESVTEIGVYAFDESDSLKYVLICNPDIILGAPFYMPHPDVTVCCPEGTDIENKGYERIIYCNLVGSASMLTDGTLLTNDGKTLTSLPYNYSKNYIIPEGVEVIGEEAFKYAESLESLTAPSTLKEIEANAFVHTPIDRVNFTDWPSWYNNVKLGNFFSNPYWSGKPYVGGVLMITPELKEGMTEIPDYKDYGLQFKDEVDLPTTIRRIGAYAFYNNKELYSVILPAGLEEIGESAFEGCTLLENPVFPDGLKKIEDCAYKDCTKITEITLPTGLTYLGQLTSRDIVEEGNADWMGSDSYRGGVFEGCTALEKAVLVADIDYLDDKIFSGCKNLQTVFLPLQLKTIGNCAFFNTGIDEITFPATLETIGDYAFAKPGLTDGYPSSITTLVIPNNVTTLGKSAFEGQAISNLIIGSGLKIIPSGAFRNNNLQTIKFSEGLVEIGESAFANNGFGHGYGNGKVNAVSTVNLPSTVTTIGQGAFMGTNIFEMTVPDKVMNLPEGSCGVPSVLTIGSGMKEINANAFSFEKLYTIRLKAHTPPTLSNAFTITEAENDRLTLIVNTGRHDYYSTNARWKQIDRIIEEGQSEIIVNMTGNYTISMEIRLTSGLMPSSVTKMKVVGPLTANDLVIIKENMPALTSLDLGEVKNVKTIPTNQFSGSLLTDIILPSDLETIGDGAFANCGLLQIKELPNTLKAIGQSAFFGSPRVNISAIPASLETIGNDAFNATGIKTIIANDALKELGSGVFADCTLLETVDLSASALTSIPESAFNGCTELDEVILPETVKTIGVNAFAGAALRNIDFASGVSDIGSGAFSNNRRLVTATLPESLKTIGENLFSNCPRLITISMSSSITGVGTQVFNGDRKLANISCASIVAPTAESGAFDGLRMRYVSLIVPTLSYQAYLDAPGWGRFQTVKNLIPVVVSKGVSASVVSEDEYQQMLRIDELEAAEDAAAQEMVQNTYTQVASASGGSYAETGVATRAVRRAIARANTLRHFASLFDGAQIQTGAEDSGMRIFINPEEGVKVVSILFNDEELLPAYEENNSILLPRGAKGSLRILTDARVIDVESIELNMMEAKITEEETVQLTATVLPAEATDKTVTWSSSDETVAIVDANGLVTGVNTGAATITAKTANGLTATCVITVDKKSGIDGVNDDSQIRVIARDGVIIIEAPEGLDVEVYSVKGMRVAQTREHRIEGLTGGVYIVRISGKSFKVLIK